MVRGSSQGVGAMGFFNVIITLGVGLVMLFGAAITYKNRMAEMEGQPLAAVVERPAKGSGLAPLPKWDDKNWKGLTYK
jgi:hypothetical protein